MIESEYVKSMNCNYERIKLEASPEEKRYQYCIVSRGGITGLLPCSLRSINGESFLYYDITSKQSLNQIFQKKTVDRQWVKDFVWNMKRISRELGRFLLDEANVIWYPDQIYQELGDNRWNFLYYPYYKGDNGFRNFLEFIVEKINYEDSSLVECVYKIYEQYDSFGDSYLKDKIYTDIQALDEMQAAEDCGSKTEQNNVIEKIEKTEDIVNTVQNEQEEHAVASKNRKGLLSFLEGSRKKDKEAREKCRAENHYLMDNGEPMPKTGKVAENRSFYKIGKNTGNDVVCNEPGSFREGNTYLENYTGKNEGGYDENPDDSIGRTVYMENVAENTDSRRRIYDVDGKMLRVLAEDSLVLGKKTGEADVIINNSSVSRVHARISYSNGEYIIEDLNSTNGTFKNGLRLKPYEKRKLTQGDEIKLGSVAIMYG